MQTLLVDTRFKCVDGQGAYRTGEHVRAKNWPKIVI
jgi:hypothetical protein